MPRPKVLRDRKHDLCTARDELETKVAERTSELRRSAEELQKSEFYLADGQRLAHLGIDLHAHDATRHYPWLEAQSQATLNVIPAYTWYALPNGGLTFVNK
jgi:hypothetical protein